ncbi:acyl-CoA N-acyltransferase [Suhomyces tanzawaensis NRRL Y-17324]|uniref:Acyl-CoA N-acyltransferase n=1 Tax=Suhomyces tanzawaensis NRRL Y-17324 TaxID=984487 RepID=A0A1E4SKD4_9ASCO|nr:acyl-CoA N-acyltransferase [Suhomyces tanzawaensis NRRL Y-17324]ODV79963.1 acyl-CoA N-acyltransferase [Suhomyces tanzawaensis NRRL Y-17324]
MGRDIISLDDITPNNIGVLQKINEVSLPTTYSEQWYKDSLASDQIVKLSFYSELPVGGIKAKSFNSSSTTNTYETTQQLQIKDQIPNAVYIESLAVLEAYRGLGIGSKLLEYAIEETKKRFVHEIILHAHVENQEVISWYEKRGFMKGSIVPEYYKAQGLKNPDAVVLTLKV